MKFLKTVSIIISTLTTTLLFANSYYYNVDLINVTNDKVHIELKCPAINSELISFHFPMTVPGTYDVLNYGVYIENLKAFDKDGNKLKVKKNDENTFVIQNANRIARISYNVNDTWDSGVKKNRIFEPAGTNFEQDKNFVVNTGGMFGFFEGMESLPFEVEFHKPDTFVGVTSLATVYGDKDKQVIKARDYHQLIDSPIMFSQPDTAQIIVGKTIVTIAVYTENGDRMAGIFRDSIKPYMLAIQQFLGELPVDNYSFIIWIKNLRTLGKSDLINFGEGALEHDNSSVYFIGESGDSSYVMDIIENFSLHEFLHIITPLNLHSDLIGNFNYINPKMSKHLWLYEGITEYFAGLVRLKGKLLEPYKYLRLMRSKIDWGQDFPNEKMSFTEMSQNVFSEPYKEQYEQVYDRGAVLGMLLDFEIMKLTNGEKTLKDVVLNLSKKYGSHISFNEDEIFKEFAAEVHPDLLTFFDRFIAGKDSLDLKSGFQTIGIEYVNQIEQKVPLSLEAMGFKLKIALEDFTAEVKSFNEQVFTEFRKGDKFFLKDYYKSRTDSTGETLAEEMMVQLPITRNGNKMVISYPLKMKDGFKKNVLKINEQMSPEQEKLYNRWINN